MSSSCRWIRSVIGVAALCLAGPAAFGEGLLPEGPATLWPQWQGRLAIDTQGSGLESRFGPTGNGLKINRASLLGDYYFSRSIAPSGRASGFRATSGLVYGPAAQSGLAAPLMPAAGQPFQAARRDRWGLSVPSARAAAADNTTVPYLGIGYTEVSPKGGWGFSADFGLVGLNDRTGVKFGQSAGAQGLDDVLRDMRLSPLLQLGISYSF